MSLALGLAVAAGGVVVGRWIAKALAPRGPAEPEEEARDQSGKTDVFDRFPCRLGDVVVRLAERDEAWLAAALVFEEERPIGALFVAPEAGTDRAIFVRAEAQGVIWLDELGPKDIPAKGEPPHTLEHEGVRFERVRRLPVRVTRRGAGAPSVGDRAVVAEYAAATAARIVLVAGSEQALAWIGVALEATEFDVLPGGKATLD